MEGWKPTGDKNVMGFLNICFGWRNGIVYGKDEAGARESETGKKEKRGLERAI